MRLKFLQENLIDEKSIIKILKDYINISRKPKLGSAFLTKDGTFINLGENEDDSHGDIISYLENEDIFLFDDHWQFSENFGYIRMNSGTTTDFNAYIEFLEDKPTSEQYDGIENWLYYILNSGVKEVEINVPNSKSIRYSLVDYLPEDIIKKVKRYYGSGTLYESSYDNSKYKLEESYTKNSMFFLSDKNMDGKTLEPRVPNNFLVKNGYEDSKSKRVCFAPSIDKALMAISQNLKGKKFFVHTPVNVEEQYVYQPSVKEVPDVNITGEIWYTAPVKLKTIGEIEVIEDDGLPGHTYTYGKDNSAELYGWKWQWIDRKDLNEFLQKSISTKHKIIEEKWEIADMEQDDPVEADVFVSDDVRDIIREINKSSHWKQYKFVLDENKGLYIMLDPFSTIHDDAFDFVFDNYWYPELINNGNDAYGDYKSKHWNTKLIYIMVTFGTTEDGLPNDLGQDYFNYAYMYPNFNILTRTTNFTNTELYKLLGKEDKFMDVSEYSGIQENLYVDNKTPARGKRMDEGAYDDEEEDVSEQITNEFLDVWDDFYHCSTEDILDLLEYTPSDKIDASSPMFILPNGKIVNVADVVEQWDYEYPLVHHALPQVMAYVILKDICSRYGVEAEQFMYEEDGLLDNVTDEMIHNLTYAKDWARINCGTLAVESRFYCVLPNHMKSAQYYTLEEWLLWGEQHNKKEVLVFCGNEQQNQKYKFDELFVEGIMKKIKRFYSSGVLHEGRDNRKVLYRGEGDSNYSVGRTPMAGLFYATNYDDASNFSDNVVKYKLNSNSKIYKGQSSLNYCIENDLMGIQDEDLKNMLGVSTLIDMYEEDSVPDGYFPKDEYLDDRPFFGTQLIAKKDLQKKGYDGAYWKWEDDLTPQQYQIWNMSVVEKLDQIKEDFSNIDKSEYLKFQSYVESIIDRKMKIVNRELDKFGFEVEYIDDYDFTENDQWIGVFYNEIQNAADVFPIAINIPFLYRECKKDKYLKDDLPYHIEKTIWHEAGHGIFEYLYDVFDLEDLDEEKVVEEYASYQVGDMNSPGDLLDYLYQYLEDN